MSRKRHTPEQIVRMLRTAEQLLNQGQAVADVCCVIGFAQSVCSSGASSVATYTQEQSGEREDI